MRYLKSLCLAILAIGALALTGCGQAPLAPTVSTMAAPGKPLELYQQDIRDCKAFALDSIGGQDAVDRVSQNAAGNALLMIGANVAVGALEGQATHHHNYYTNQGAANGAAAGTAAGMETAAAGNQTLQQQFDNFYSQCMYSKGNQVPGMAQAKPIAPPASSYTNDGDSRILEAQQALAGAGYDPGTPDGKMGKKTVVALRQFQKDNGLPATGKLDSRTYKKLSEM